MTWIFAGCCALVWLVAVWKLGQLDRRLRLRADRAHGEYHEKYPQAGDCPICWPPGGEP